MERNTKILLGLAAAGVVAYLVFKPKKAANKIPPTKTKNTTDRLICPNGYTLGTKVVGGVVGLIGACKDENGNWSNVEPIVNPDFVEPVPTPEIQQLDEFMQQQLRKQQLGITPDYIDNSDACRLYGHCKM
jgi:hypothetical protein